MLAHHRDLAITPGQRFGFASLMSLAADDADLLAAPEFRAAFVGYLEWAPGWSCTTPSPGQTSCSRRPCPLGPGRRPALPALTAIPAPPAARCDEFPAGPPSQCQRAVIARA